MASISAFSTKGLNFYFQSDENLLIFESASLAGAYNNYFDALFAQYQKNGAKLPPT